MKQSPWARLHQEEAFHKIQGRDETNWVKKKDHESIELNREKGRRRKTGTGRLIEKLVSWGRSRTKGRGLATLISRRGRGMASPWGGGEEKKRMSRLRKKGLKFFTGEGDLPGSRGGRGNQGA